MFITFEGSERSGKSTQLVALASFLRQPGNSQGRPLLTTREPGGTPIGDQVRAILMGLQNTEMLPRTEIPLFQASRAQLVEQVIRPRLTRNGIVLCVRFGDSTLAYQGYGYQQFDLHLLRQLVDFATGQIEQPVLVADAWRTATLARIGEKPWKAIYALLSIAGFVLIVIGYGAARQSPVVLYTPPVWTRHVAALLTLPAFVLLVAAYVQRNAFKRAIGHPMVAGVKIWALAHLLANGTLADVLLFGGFLLWAVLSFTAARRRDRLAGVAYPAGIGHAHRDHRGGWRRRVGGVRLRAAPAAQASRPSAERPATTSVSP